MHAPNFITSSQDFQIMFMKKVTDLKNSKISDIPARINSKMRGQELPFWNCGASHSKQEDWNI